MAKDGSEEAQHTTVEANTTIEAEEEVRKQQKKFFMNQKIKILSVIKEIDIDEKTA